MRTPSGRPGKGATPAGTGPVATGPAGTGPVAPGAGRTGPGETAPAAGGPAGTGPDWTGPADPRAPDTGSRAAATGDTAAADAAAGDAATGDAAAGDAATAAPAADRTADPVALRVATGVLVAVAAAGLAVVECFLVPLRIGTVRFPVCVPLAIAGNILLARLAARRTGSLLAGAAPPAVWLLAVVVLSLPRPEGDVVVEGTLTGLIFLFAGAVAGAYGVAGEITRRGRPESPVRR